MRKALVVSLILILLNSSFASAYFGSQTSLTHGLTTMPSKADIEGAVFSDESLREIVSHLGKPISMHDLTHSTQEEVSRVLGGRKIDPVDAIFEVSMLPKESVSYANLTSGSRLILSSIQGVAQWGDLPESIRDEVASLLIGDSCGRSNRYEAADSRRVPITGLVPRFWPRMDDHGPRYRLGEHCLQQQRTSMECISIGASCQA